jgi:hypothetical protein
MERAGLGGSSRVHHSGRPGKAKDSPTQTARKGCNGRIWPFTTVQARATGLSSYQLSGYSGSGLAITFDRASGHRTAWYTSTVPRRTPDGTVLNTTSRDSAVKRTGLPLRHASFWGQYEEVAGTTKKMREPPDVAWRLVSLPSLGRRLPASRAGFFDASDCERLLALPTTAAVVRCRLRNYIWRPLIRPFAVSQHICSRSITFSKWSCGSKTYADAYHRRRICKRWRGPAPPPQATDLQIGTGVKGAPGRRQICKVVRVFGGGIERRKLRSLFRGRSIQGTA